MIKVLKNGFLDEKMLEKIDLVKEKHKDIFELLDDFNKISYKIMDCFKGKNATEENQYLLPAFVETNKLYQSSIIMLEYGLKNSFESLLRNILELWFQMSYVFSNFNNVRKLEKYTYYQTIRKLDYIKAKQLYDVIPKEVVDKRYLELEQLKQELKSQGVTNPLNIPDMCEQLGLEKEYAYYSFLSDYTHSDFSNIFGLNIFTNKGIFVFKDGTYKDFKNDSLRLLNIYEKILSKMIDIYAQDLKEELNNILTRAIKVYKNYEEETK